jgi:hypothetical protein
MEADYSSFFQFPDHPLDHAKAALPEGGIAGIEPRTV